MIYPLPPDIVKRIDQLCPDSEQHQEMLRLITIVFETQMNVGNAQLARAALVISGGDPAQVKRLIDAYFYGDARDVILEAEQKAGNPGHGFVPPFED